MFPTVIEIFIINLINEFRESLVALGLESKFTYLDIKHFIGKNNQPLSYEIEKELKNFPATKAYQSVRAAEIIDRINDLAEGNITQKIASVLWFGEQGEKEHIVILEELKNVESEDTLNATIETAISRIYERTKSKRESLFSDKNVQNLTDFFDLRTGELEEIVDKMIRNEESEAFAPLPDTFVPDLPSQALSQLNITKKKIESLIIKDEIKNWLVNPQRVLVDKTPKEAIEAGKVYRVLQMLMRLEEGSH